jgi:hypothetical protein
MPELDVAGKRSLLELIEGATGRSRSEIRRLAKQNAIKLDEETVDLDRLQADGEIEPGVLKVGKRHWYRLVATLESAEGDEDEDEDEDETGASRFRKA